MYKSWKLTFKSFFTFKKLYNWQLRGKNPTWKEFTNVVYPQFAYVTINDGFILAKYVKLNISDKNSKEIRFYFTPSLPVTHDFSGHKKLIVLEPGKRLDRAIRQSKRR